MEKDGIFQPGDMNLCFGYYKIIKIIYLSIVLSIIIGTCYVIPIIQLQSGYAVSSTYCDNNVYNQSTLLELSSTIGSLNLKNSLITIGFCELFYHTLFLIKSLYYSRIQFSDSFNIPKICLFFWFIYSLFMIIFIVITLTLFNMNKFICNITSDISQQNNNQYENIPSIYSNMFIMFIFQIILHVILLLFYYLIVRE